MDWKLFVIAGLVVVIAGLGIAWASGTFPGASTDNALVRFDGTGGSTVQNGQTVEDDSGNVVVTGSVTAGGADGARRLQLNNNSARSPTASKNEIYPEGNIWKINENGIEKVLGGLELASYTVWNPDGIQGTEDAIPFLPVEAEWAPNGIEVVDCGIKIDAAGSYTIVFEEWTDPTTHDNDIETVTTGAAATEAEDDGTLSHSTIEAGNLVFIDLPTTDKNFLTVWLTFYRK